MASTWARPPATKPPLNAAEEVAPALIDRILTDGGQELWQRYLTRKSFIFAKDNAENVSVSRVMMCCPGHDLTESAEDWMLEPEPETANPDCWARMFLRSPDHASKNVAPNCEAEAMPDGLAGERLSAQIDGAPDGLVRPSSAPNLLEAQPIARRRTVHSSSETSSQTSRSDSKSGFKFPPRGGVLMKPKDERASPLPDMYEVDDEMDKFRWAKAKEEARKARLAEEERLAQLAEEEEERRLERKRRADEMNPRQYTYGTDGKIIWVEEPDPEELPAVLTQAQHSVEVTANDIKSAADFIGRSSQLPPPSANLQKSAAAKRRAHGRRQTRKTVKSGEDAPEVFTDTFYKPEYMQPPLMDTMVVRPGVVLECGGQRKLGHVAAGAKRQMSRREYLIMLADGQPPLPQNRPSSATGAGAEAQKSAADPPKRPGSAPIGQRSNEAPAPNSRQSHGGHAPSNSQAVDGERAYSKGSGGQDSEPGVARVARGLKQNKPLMIGWGSYGVKNQKAPPAPAWSVRSNSRSLGNMLPRPPRYHVAPLGGSPSNRGAIQPPLGETMGHGIIRESYFTPPSSHPSSPENKQLARASSAPAVTRKRSQ